MSRENDVFSQIAVCLLHALGFISWSLEISSRIGLYLIQMRNVSCKKDYRGYHKATLWGSTVGFHLHIIIKQ